jgi:hypothetical protein
VSDPKWEVEFIEEHGVVQLRATGEMGLEEIFQWSADAFELASSKASRLLLHDLREMAPALSTESIYRLPEALSALGLTRRMRVAILVSPSNVKMADFELFESVAKGSRFCIKLFLSRKDALDWLSSKE